jgi:hypothetical protein
MDPTAITFIGCPAGFMDSCLFPHDQRLEIKVFDQLFKLGRLHGFHEQVLFDDVLSM